MKKKTATCPHCEKPLCKNQHGCKCPDWPEALPPGVQWSDFQHPVLAHARVHKEPVYSLLNMRRRGDLIIPDYQRAKVWTPVQQAKFVGFFLEGAPAPAIYIREVNNSGPGPDFLDELVDGQQRLDALMAFEDGEIPAWLPSQDRCMWIKDMDWPGWRLNVCFPTGRFRGTKTEAMTLYLAINSQGIPHTEAELERVRNMIKEQS